jgi:hypothetical protein
MQAKKKIQYNSVTIKTRAESAREQNIETY